MVIKKYNIAGVAVGVILGALIVGLIAVFVINTDNDNCLLYTSDAADE